MKNHRPPKIFSSPRKTLLAAGLVFFAFVLAAAFASAETVLLSESFNYPDGLITNEYAFWNSGTPGVKTSPIWELDSGSLFASGGTGWTGSPNDISPNAASSNGNNSAVFRLTTKRSDFGDVAVSLSVLNQGLSPSPSTPAVDWDGLHIWLRYQSEYYLYYASINRRDNSVVIKKKIPGGPSNDGTYYELSSYVPYNVPYNSWQQVKATVKNNADGSVTINLYSNGILRVSATDNGTIGGPPIRNPGKVGMRGDNANLKFDNFQVTDLVPGNPTPTPTPTPAAITAPTGVVATPGDARVSVSWNPVQGATSYNLYRSRSPGVTKANGYKIPNVTSPFVNTGFVNGTAYYMVVTAVNSSGESSESAEVSATPKSGTTSQPPAAPSNVRAVASDSKVTVSWDPVAGATSYNLYRSRYPGVTKTNGYKISNAASPYVNTGFVNGTMYYMMVTAVNSAGEGVASVEVSAKPTAAQTIPTAPQGVKATPGNTQLSVSWNPVPGATSYNLYRSRYPGVTKANGYKIANVTSPFLNKGFVNGTAYYMMVTAVNALGESENSQEVSGTPSASLAILDGGIVTASDADLSTYRVYPNPWRSDKNTGSLITFDQLGDNATIKIFTVAGSWVRTLQPNTTSATWDLTNDSGEKVSSGLYVYLITNSADQKKRGTLVVVR